jgi:hypothetical protein
MKIQVSVNLEIKGELPTKRQRDDIIDQIKARWPDYIYEWDGGLATTEISVWVVEE